MLEPIEPELHIPSEPIPEFTHMMHDATGRCSKDHVFSASSFKLRMARFFGGPHIGSDLDWPAYNDHLCPYCERERWVAKRDEAQRAHAKNMRDYRRERQRWDELGNLESHPMFGQF